MNSISLTNYSCFSTYIVPGLRSLTSLTALSVENPIYFKHDAANKPVLPKPAAQCTTTLCSLLTIYYYTNFLMNYLKLFLSYGTLRSKIGYRRNFTLYFSQYFYSSFISIC